MGRAQPSQEFEEAVSSKSRRNQPQRSSNQQRSQRNKKQQQPPPPQTGFRPALERFSAPLLVRLHAMPRWLVPILLGVFLLTGLISSGSWIWLGAVLLGIVTLFVAWLSALAWPVLTPGSRLARVIVTIALVGITVLKAMGRL